MAREAEPRGDRLRYRAAVVLVAAAAAAACNAILGNERRELDALEGGPDVDTPSDADPPDAARDAPVDAHPDEPLGDARHPGPCGEVAGPAMVQITAGGTKLCIHATEVTVADYRHFLAEKGGDTAGQPPECATNTSYVPGAALGPADHPVRGVDWCDAVAYCAWANAALCGKIGGGDVPSFTEANDAKVDEWFFACTRGGDGTKTYPYGATYEPTACNGADRDAGGTVPVGSLPGCQGGFPGVFDMSGNVIEWERQCDARNNCLLRGGSFGKTDRGALTCTALVSGPRDLKNDDVGFRCCRP